MVDFYIVCAIVIAVSIFFLILTVKVIIDSERKKEFVFDEESLEMITLYDWHLRRKSETIYISRIIFGEDVKKSKSV